MKKFTKIIEQIESGKFFKVEIDVELVIPADNLGEASYIADSTMASIKNMSEYVISNVEETEKVLENTNNESDDYCGKIAKSFAEFLRHECVVSSDEGYYYEGETYGVDDIYNIFKSKV